MSRKKIFNIEVVKTGPSQNREDRRIKYRMSTLFTKKKTRGRTRTTWIIEWRLVTRPSQNLIAFVQYALLKDSFSRE